MHIKYCKAILGVHRKSTNFAVLFELCRNPLYHKIIKALLYHWFRLGTLNPFLSYSTKRTRSQKVFSCTIIRHGLHLSTKFWVSYLISKVLTYQNQSTYSFKKEVIMYYKTKCNIQEVGDEQQFLLMCSKYSNWIIGNDPRYQPKIFLFDTCWKTGMDFE